MRTIVELNHQDIIQAIANVYDVDSSKVMLTCTKTWVGYAQNEHEELSITAKVVLNNGGAERRNV